MSQENSRFAPAAAAIFAIALTGRLVHVWQIQSAPFFSVLMGDSHGYDEWAQRIAGGDWFGREVFYQAPLYPYFLGVLYATAGRYLLLVRIVQAVIGSASCALLALAARRLFSPRAGIAAGLILAFYAPAIFFDGLLQKSVLDVFFVCLSLWMISGITVRLKADTTDGEDERRWNAKDAKLAKRDEHWRSSRSLRSSSWQWLSLGLAMGGLSLTRENAVVFIVVIVAWALSTRRPDTTSHAKTAKHAKERLPLRSSRPLREACVGATLFLLGLAIVIVPVAVRNSLVGGGLYVTTSQFGPNFYIGNNPRADGTYASLRYGRGAPEFERQDATELAEHALGRRLTPADVSGYWTDRALDFVTSNPAAWLKLVARKMALLWNRAEMVDTESQETHGEWSMPLRILGPVTHFGVLVPLAVFGLIVTWPMRRRLWVLHAMLLAYAASVVMFYVFARYRYPLVPFLVLFASAGLVGIKSRIPNPKSRLAVAAVLVATASVANWPILSTDLMRAVTENNLAVALQVEQRYDEAKTHYERALTLRSDYAPAYSNLGTALRAQGRVGDAVAAYERALQLRPDYPDAHYNLANALFEAGRTDAAIEHFQVALKTVLGSVEAHNNLGIALAGQGRVDEALDEFRTAVQLDPSSATSHRNLGDLLASARRKAQGIEHLRRATELAPADGSFHYDLGSVLLEAGRAADAEVEFRSALKTMPNSVEAHNNLGIALESQGKLNEAIGEFEHALRIKPDFADARKNLSLALAAKKQR